MWPQLPCKLWNVSWWVGLKTSTEFASAVSLPCCCCKLTPCSLRDLTLSSLCAGACHVFMQWSSAHCTDQWDVICAEADLALCDRQRLHCNDLPQQLLS